ncbi:toll-like receptor 7 [Sitodiplosis mosellana]|uniref:toll-like receptor 7 n=1 Tax=Sitodiplosis mosellana TaxID=263140 RepID=UPI002444F846|nr:toll-like receptor 7 [Sitodiplosis mosellana]
MLMFKGVLLIFSCSSAFEISYCNYNATDRHIEYVCDVSSSSFADQATEYLYCDNYASEIKKEEVEWLSLRVCKAKELSNDFLDVYYSNLNMLNISHIGIETIRASDLRNVQRLNMLVASHNRLHHIPVDLFISKPELFIVDLSFNQITQLDPSVFDSVQNLMMLFLSTNLIEELHAQTFSNLHLLELLDLSNNRIKIIDNNLLVANYVLQIIGLNDNQVKRLECEFLATLTKMRSLNIALNTLERVDSSCTNAGVHIDIEIISNESTTELRVSEGHFVISFIKNDFSKIRHLNLSSRHIENVAELVHEINPLIELLDISSHDVKDLHGNTFKEFRNLKQLYLSRTNVTFLDFAMLFNETLLEVLDLSYNNLNEIDVSFIFILDLLDFSELKTLNLKGNNFSSIDDVMSTDLPNLSVLNIAENHFSCEYLVGFLIKWINLEVILDNRSDETYFNGIDCVRENPVIYKMFQMNNVTFVVNNFVDNSINHSEDVQTINSLH